MIYLLLCVALLAPAQAAPASAPATQQVLPVDVAGYLQDISVTIHASGSQGSGVIFTRDGVNYVWTAGHVIDGLRKVREVVDTKTGASKSVVEFEDAVVVKELTENGRRVGELKMDAEVLRYSNANTGQDLALLRIRKKHFVEASAVFYLDAEIPKIGSPLLHCGSLLGQLGANSMTTGILSQIGRVFEGNVYDQTTCAVFPGSSGGGIFLTDGRYVGMLVRGAGETFNLIVPARRLTAWADRVGVRFAIDASVPVPSEDELKAIPVEDSGSNFEMTKKQ